MSENPMLAWQAITLPTIDPAEWTGELLDAGLREIRRVRSQLEAAQAVLVGLVAARSGRDTKARLARELFMSSGEASQAVKVAKVVELVPGALDALVRGQLSGDQIARLAPLAGTDAAAELLAVASACSPEELSNAVTRRRIRDDGDTWHEKQRKRRFLSFFRDPHGGMGLRAHLSTADGERVKATIESICEERFRRDHPERNENANDSTVEPRDRRLADALVEAVCGNETDGANASAARTALIVTVDAETLDASVVSGPPLSLDDVHDLIRDARTDVYALIRNLHGTVLNFGRSRRLASAMQRLVLAVRDGGCRVAGCHTSWQECDAHHEPPFEDGGRTDLDHLDLRCRTMHHPHRHQHDPPRAA